MPFPRGSRALANGPRPWAGWRAGSHGGNNCSSEVSAQGGCPAGPRHEEFYLHWQQLRTESHRNINSFRPQSLNCRTKNAICLEQNLQSWDFLEFFIYLHSFNRKTRQKAILEFFFFLEVRRTEKNLFILILIWKSIRKLMDFPHEGCTFLTGKIPSTHRFVIWVISQCIPWLLLLNNEEQPALNLRRLPAAVATGLFFPLDLWGVVLAAGYL